MATQNFKRNLLLNLYRKGEKKVTLVCFFLPLKKEKNVSHLQPIFSVQKPLAFLPVTPWRTLGSNTQADPNIHVQWQGTPRSQNNHMSLQFKGPLVCWAKSLQSHLTGRAHQAPQSIEFFRQEYWSGLSFPPPGDLPDPGIEPGSPALQADSLPTEPPGNRNRNRVHNKWTALETSQILPPPLSVKKLSSKKTPEVKEGTSSVLSCPRLLA